MAAPRFACHSDADIEAILNHLLYFSVKIVKLFIKYVEELISSLKQRHIINVHETIHV